MVFNILSSQLSFFFDKGAIEMYTPAFDFVLPYTTIYILIGFYTIKLVWENR